MTMKGSCVLFLLVLSCIWTSEACTSLGVGKKASGDGSTMVAHSSDGEGSLDPRLVRIPAADHAAGSQRPVFYAPEDYPRYVGYDRYTDDYYPVNNQSVMKPIGYLPEVNHTFAYFEETYGIMNEHGVSMAESTCSSIYGAKPLGYGGNALLSIDTLSQLAMERATSALEAVTLMGSLSEKYGFYGAGASGESMIVSDLEEVWVFQILADPTGTSSIYCAQKIPDDSIAVVANMFTIRNIDFNDTSTFICSTTIQKIAQDEGLWTPGTAFDFTQLFSQGEYGHKYYSGRRMWRAYQLAAPAVSLSPTYKNLLYDAYPTAVAASNVTLDVVTGIMRDYYENTAYDMTVGLAGGAFGTPDRYGGGAGEQTVQGNWERSIAIYRTADTFVAQNRADLPVEVGATLWYGPHAAHGTVFTPFASVVTEIPESYRYNAEMAFSRNSAFWAFRYVENLCNLKWSYMIEDVKSEQQKYASSFASLQAQADKDWLANQDIAKVTELYGEAADNLVSRWWNLADELMVKYADGYVTETWSKPVSTGYPAWWLTAVNYTNGPPPVPSVLHGVYPTVPGHQ